MIKLTDITNAASEHELQCLVWRDSEEFAAAVWQLAEAYRNSEKRIKDLADHNERMQDSLAMLSCVIREVRNML